MVPKVTDTAGRAKSLLYKVALLEETRSPEGSEEQSWHRYVLDNGRSTIEGQRRGTLKDVTTYATQYAEQLNERTTMARSTWSPSGAKPTQAAKAKTPSK